MKFSRRDTLALGAGAVVVTVLPLGAGAAVAADLIADFTGGADMRDTGITLNAPEIAENGNTVPIKVSAAGAVSIILVATDNPEPGVARFNFGPLSGAQSVSTRIRLARTQDVIALAKFADGTFARTNALVKVTIGGCGG